MEKIMSEENLPANSLRKENGSRRLEAGGEDSRPVFRLRPIDRLRGNRLFWTAVLLAMATLLSTVKPVVLSDGGAVTCFSLLFLWLVTFFYGPKYGAAAGVVFGFSKLGVTYLTGEFINYAPGALLLEYPVAYGAFALGGLMLQRRQVQREEDGVERDSFGLRAGFLLGVFCLGACYILSANLFYPPDRVGFWANFLFTISYDMSYLLIEAVMTELLLCIPAVLDAIYYLRFVATTPKKDPTLRSF